eukprot:14900675-Alexandrium_andersonii.AAC.1
MSQAMPIAKTSTPPRSGATGGARAVGRRGDRASALRCAGALGGACTCCAGTCLACPWGGFLHRSPTCRRRGG